ncbi:hypothetical protein ACFSC4_26215 [Deinococcus malanensis]|nr:hypothetical protein [Deinococcus malanensis]
MMVPEHLQGTLKRRGDAGGNFVTSGEMRLLQVPIGIGTVGHHS